MPLDDGALDGVERALLYAVTDWKSALNRAEKLPAMPPWLGHLVYVTDRAFWRYDTYAALLTHHLGHLLRRAGDLSSARHYLAESVAIWWESQGTYLTTATMLEDLGGVLLDLGDFAAAETAYTRAYELWCKAVGEQHARTLGDLTNLGRVFMRKHDWAAARDTFARALAGYTALLGPDHPNTQAVQDLLDAVSSMLPE